MFLVFIMGRVINHLNSKNKLKLNVWSFELMVKCQGFFLMLQIHYYYRIWRSKQKKNLKRPKAKVRNRVRRQIELLSTQIYRSKNDSLTWASNHSWNLSGEIVNKISVSLFHRFFVTKNHLQCPPLNRITLGQHKSDNYNRMIQLTDLFCVLLTFEV